MLVAINYVEKRALLEYESVSEQGQRLLITLGVGYILNKRGAESTSATIDHI
jgi:hypothetical protein